MSKRKGLALAVAIIGFLINNFAYLYDVITNQDGGIIIMGVKSYALAAAGLVILVAGLVWLYQGHASGQQGERQGET